MTRFCIFRFFGINFVVVWWLQTTSPTPLPPIYLLASCKLLYSTLKSLLGKKSCWHAAGATVHPITWSSGCAGAPASSSGNFISEHLVHDVIARLRRRWSARRENRASWNLALPTSLATQTCLLVNRYNDYDILRILITYFLPSLNCRW